MYELVRKYSECSTVTTPIKLLWNYKQKPIQLYLLKE